MADTALIVANNLSHNVAVRIEEAKTSLSHLANVQTWPTPPGSSALLVKQDWRTSSSSATRD